MKIAFTGDIEVIGITNVRVVLSHRAVSDLNEQAREWAETQHD
ncbi:hypothetical protein [Pandoraea soli]